MPIGFRYKGNYEFTLERIDRVVLPWVTSYYAGWFWDWAGTVQNALDRVDPTTFTHFVFGRYAPGAGGALIEKAGTGHTAAEQALINKVHNFNKSALMMVGGAGDGNNWLAATIDKNTRSIFIKNILDKCVQKDYEGVDIDWEEQLDNDTKRNQLIVFLEELRLEADKRDRYRPLNPSFIITFPGFCLNLNLDKVGSWKVKVASLVDQYNLMSYNQNFAAGGWYSWLFNALKGHAQNYPTSVEGSINAYVAAGIDRKKLGIGLGLFCNGYKLPTTDIRQPQPQNNKWGTTDYTQTWAKWYIEGLYKSENQVFDEQAQAYYYRYNPPIDRETMQLSILTNESLEDIALKGAWVRAGNCGGVIIWTENYGWVNGSNPPMQAVKNAFLT